MHCSISGWNSGDRSLSACAARRRDRGLTQLRPNPGLRALASTECASSVDKDASKGGKGLRGRCGPGKGAKPYLVHNHRHTLIQARDSLAGEV